MRNRIVLDKSFLQAVSTRRLLELHEEHDLVMTDALFYELITTDRITRSRCFSKFPQVENPVRIVGHIGPLILHEQRTHTRAADFLSYETTERFRFNPSLRRIDYELPENAQKNTDKETVHIFGSVERFVERTNDALSFFGPVSVGSDANRKSLLHEFEVALSKPEQIIRFYSSIGDPHLPPPAMLNEEWATYRFFQVNLYFTLNTLYRHRGAIPLPLSKLESVRLEHDVHDANVLLTAVMAGGLATKEKKLIRWWNLICPGRPLYSS